MARGTVHYWAAARAAAGTASEGYDAPTVGAVLDAAVAAHGTALARVLPRCSVLVDGTRATRDHELPDGATIEVLPPFAGG